MIHRVSLTLARQVACLGIWVQVSSRDTTCPHNNTINLGSEYRCRHTTCLHNNNKLEIWVQVSSHYLSTEFLMMTINLGSGYRCLIRCGVKTAGSDSPLFWGISGQARKSQKSIGVPSPASSLFRSSPWSSSSKSISNRKRPFSLAGLMQLNSSPQSGNQPLQDSQKTIKFSAKKSRNNINNNT